VGATALVPPQRPLRVSGLQGVADSGYDFDHGKHCCPSAQGLDQREVEGVNQSEWETAQEEPALQWPYPRYRPRQQPRDLDPPVVLADRVLDVPDLQGAQRAAAGAGHAPGHLGDEVASAEQLEAAQDGLVARAGEEERAAPPKTSPSYMRSPPRRASIAARTWLMRPA
jgi:hypothetical protein